MTTDRKKAILFLSITFILGILIGTLLPGFYGRLRHRQGREIKGEREREGRHFETKQTWFSHMIMRIVKPDSAQAKLIRPLTEEAAAKIGELEKGSNERMAAIMDSLKLKLQPILSPEQQKRLNDFSSKANNRLKPRRGGR